MKVPAALLSPLLLSLPSTTSAHGSLVTPRSRNSIDYLANVNTQSCSNITGDVPCHNGQASFWYSQGCFIGCPTCDHLSGRRQTDLCKLGFKATVNEPSQRSVSRNTTAGGPNDIYRHNPWRAPGFAPTADACGLAGGTPWGADAPEAGFYTNTTYAHHGMRGTSLPPMPTGATWRVGGEATVSWNVRNNHGGGYSYRLCPASEPLTEACFQKHPLQFVRTKQAILFANGSTFPIAGTWIDIGTSPPGSTWAMIPIPPAGLGPRCLPGPGDTNSTPNGCMHWEGRDDGHNGHVPGPCVPCPETPGSDCSRCDNGGADTHTPSFPPPFPGVQGSPIEGILDVLYVPPSLTPGDYILGWRYDCEATAQVWSNCADVTLTV
jgi:hypothetical protein